MKKQFAICVLSIMGKIEFLDSNNNVGSIMPEAMLFQSQDEAEKVILNFISENEYAHLTIIPVYSK